MSDWPTGYVQVYTGDGKGKTTAALGLAIRAAGAGLKVLIGQFTKDGDYSEIQALKRFDDLITVRQFGNGGFIFRDPDEKDKLCARAGLNEMREAVNSGDYNLVIFEEANIAVHYNLFTVEDLLEIIENKPEHVELLFTGRRAHEKLLARADLVTEMKEHRHYYRAGVPARKGIEK